MPRQKNIKPTSIYWLFDMRPEMVTGDHPRGQPFYCGKTVQKPEVRLQDHRKKPNGDVGPRIFECGEYIRMEIIEVVAPEQDWAARERFWIYTGRMLYPGKFLNITDGGQGAPGWVPSARWREKMLAANIGKKCTPETRAKMSASGKRRWRLPEVIARIRATQLGRKHSPEVRAKLSAAARRRKKVSLETRAKMSAAARRRHAREQGGKTLTNGF